ncbi:MAG TPA: GNAT family N-acetyltransferase [Gaiellaceae bacterium]
MRIADYGPSRRADVADLMALVWGARPDEAELEWFYERNPVRPASVLLGEEDGQVVATVAMSFHRRSIGGRELEVGMPLRVATDPVYRGRGIFAELEHANEERARERGVALLLTVPNAASAPVFLEKLGWKALPLLRVWARLRPPARRGARLERFDDPYLDWRFVDAPRDYALYADGTVVGRRGHVSYVARGRPSAAMLTLRGSLQAGFIPTPKTFTLLGKSLDGSLLPDQVDFEFGDLDFM